MGTKGELYMSLLILEVFPIFISNHSLCIPSDFVLSIGDMCKITMFMTCPLGTLSLSLVDLHKIKMQYAPFLFFFYFLVTTYLLLSFGSSNLYFFLDDDCRFSLLMVLHNSNCMVPERVVTQYG